MVAVLVLCVLLVVLSFLGAPVLLVGKILIRRMLIGAVVLIMALFLLLAYDLVQGHFFTFIDFF